MTISTRLAELPPMPKGGISYVIQDQEVTALRARLSLVLEVLAAVIDDPYLDGTRESDDARLVLEAMKEFK